MNKKNKQNIHHCIETNQSNFPLIANSMQQNKAKIDETSEQITTTEL